MGGNRPTFDMRATEHFLQENIKILLSLQYRVNDTNKKLDIGPFSQSEAEWMTDEIVDSHQLSAALSQLLTGRITADDFVYLLEVLTDSLHDHYKEKMKEGA